MTPEEKIEDLKANFDYILEGKDLEIKTLGERCNQLLKDKGDLTDELSKLKETLAQTIENDEVAYETLKLHDQEEIGMLKSRVAELEHIKDMHAEEVELHLHAEEYIKSLEQKLEQTEKDLADYQFNYPTIKELEKENAELKAKNKWYSEQVCNKECAEVWGNLTKAKDLIENIIRVTWGEGWNYSLDWKVKAEQFLQEIEK